MPKTPFHSEALTLGFCLAKAFQKDAVVVHRRSLSEHSCCIKGTYSVLWLRLLFYSPLQCIHFSTYLLINRRWVAGRTSHNLVGVILTASCFRRCFTTTITTSYTLAILSLLYSIIIYSIIYHLHRRDLYCNQQ